MTVCDFEVIEDSRNNIAQLRNWPFHTYPIFSKVFISCKYSMPNFIGLKIVVRQVEEIVVPNGSTTSCLKPGSLDRKVRTQKEQTLNCPRCNLTNVKFCYYNNYSLSQPRYFCKTYRRYWTEGRSLRNIPVGGGSKKNKRSSSSSSSSSSSTSSSKKLPNLIPICFS
ncbi:unnamed protein product [Coffea canephora]|uniref:Dof zinc finger protein n=1 Tax=Coffea canephora TaxID=49390 RepID=A0A068VCT2_COFCA|nr:unnamed protein product [Coffea canephora]